MIRHVVRDSALARHRHHHRVVALAFLEVLQLLGDVVRAESLRGSAIPGCCCCRSLPWHAWHTTALAAPCLRSAPASRRAIARAAVAAITLESAAARIQNRFMIAFDPINLTVRLPDAAKLYTRVNNLRSKQQPCRPTPALKFLTSAAERTNSAPDTGREKSRSPGVPIPANRPPSTRLHERARV